MQMFMCLYVWYRSKRECVSKVTTFVRVGVCVWYACSACQAGIRSAHANTRAYTYVCIRVDCIYYIKAQVKQIKIKSGFL